MRADEFFRLPQYPVAQNTVIILQNLSALNLVSGGDMGFTFKACIAYDGQDFLAVKLCRFATSRHSYFHKSGAWRGEN